MKFWLVMYITGQLMGSVGPFDDREACENEMKAQVVAVEAIIEQGVSDEFKERWADAELKCEQH